MAISTLGSASSSSASWSSASRSDSGKLSTEQQRIVDKLASRDREVRAHEQAHLSAAGGLATSGANYTYETGPDGRRYAVGGEVGINVSPGRTPEDTLDRARRIQAAALAPAEPSGADRQIAAQAAGMAAEARIQLARQQRSGGASGEGAEASGGSASAGALDAYRSAAGLQARAGASVDTYA